MTATHPEQHQAAGAKNATLPQNDNETDMTDTHYHGAVHWAPPDGPKMQTGWNNGYFLATEFTDSRQCELISLALIGENGNEFYGKRTGFDPAPCSDFVRTVVRPQLGRFEERALPLAALRDALRAWLARVPCDSAPVLCYDYETDLNMLRFLLDGALPRGWQSVSMQARAVRRGVLPTTPAMAASVMRCTTRAPMPMPMRALVKHPVFPYSHNRVSAACGCAFPLKGEHKPGGGRNDPCA
jgi:hypothetical protein